MQHRTSFVSNRRSRASQSYDDLEDHYAALNIGQSSRHGYAKIRPRNRPMMDPTQTSKSQDISLGPSSHLLSEQINPIGTTKSQVCVQQNKTDIIKHIFIAGHVGISHG